MAKYAITPMRTVVYEPIIVEADSEGEAYDKFRDIEWITDDLTEVNSQFDYEIEED